MSNASRGINLHTMAELHEKARMRLKDMDLMDQLDRVNYVFTLMCSDDRVTARQAIEAADRYHPLQATRPASEPESPVLTQPHSDSQGLNS